LNAGHDFELILSRPGASYHLENVSVTSKSSQSGFKVVSIFIKLFFFKKFDKKSPFFEKIRKKLEFKLTKKLEKY
jgi:hypothetical protein